MEIIELLKNLSAPSIVISGILFFIKVKPISFLTANDLEKQLATKEWRFSYYLIIYIIQTLFYSTGLFIISDVLNGKLDKGNAFWFISLGITCILICLTGTLYIWKEKRKKIKIPTSKLKRSLWLFLVLFYFFGWFYVISYFAGVSIIKILDGKSFSVSMLLTALGLFFILAIILTFAFTPLYRFLEITTKKIIYIQLEVNEIEEENKNIGEKTEWYLLYPISKDEYLLGDAYDVLICKKLKVIKREKLLENTFYILSEIDKQGLAVSNDDSTTAPPKNDQVTLVSK